MLKFNKIEDKTLVTVTAQADPCKYAGEKGAYDCTYDCTREDKSRYYMSPAY